MRVFRLCCLICWLAWSSIWSSGCGFGNAASQDQLRLRWVPDSADARQMAVEVSGIDAALLGRLERSNWQSADWQRLLSVYAEQMDKQAGVQGANLPPMLGAYRIEAGVLRFRPQFPLVSGVSYRAVFRPGELPGAGNPPADALTALFELPQAAGGPATVVSHIYPSAALLPENLLKFYVHFSAPMSRGRIYDYIRLRDESGSEIELPFLEIDEELWDPEMRRLTLFIDPGRIKRGVRPLQEIGPSLEAGKSYTLEIDREWRDSAGRPLAQPYHKAFAVGPPDREPPDPARWRIGPPPPESRAPLSLAFPEPMDHALSRRVIVVTDGAGAIVAGETEMADEERRWLFTPDRAWAGGEYRLVIQTTIEDLSGNNIGKPFEVDLFDGVQRRLTASTVKLPFVIR